MLNLTGYKLTFSDEFNTLSVSQSGQNTVWADIRETSRLNSFADIGYGNSAFVDPASGINPFATGNGALTITARQAPSSIVGPGDWASGLIHTVGDFGQTYGYFEMRADLPEGLGVWPAFWLLPTDGGWPPEIDVVEAYGGPEVFSWTHTSTGPAQQTWSTQPQTTSGFHTYGVLWTKDTITYYVDGKETGVQKTPGDLHQDMSLVVSLAMEDKAGMSTANKSMVVDYVRVYSNDPNDKAVALGNVSSPDGKSVADLHGASATNVTAPAPAPAGPNSTITVQASGDQWNGNPQFQLYVDGKAFGAAQSVSTAHSSGQWQTINVTGQADLSGAHDIKLSFFNDAWNGVDDRNLYVKSITAGGQTISGLKAVDNTADGGQDYRDTGAAVMVSNGDLTFAKTATSSSPTPTTPTTPTVPTTPTTPTTPPADTSSIVVKASGDQWNGAPQFQLYVDGKAYGGVQSVTAKHATGQWQDITVKGAADLKGEHDIKLSFINDAYGGGANDRNLYVKSITVSGETVSGLDADSNSGGGQSNRDPNAAVLVSNGSLVFNDVGGTATTPTAPAPTPTPAPATGNTVSVTASAELWGELPKMKILVDGVAIDTTKTVSANHDNGQWQTVDFKGAFDPAKAHTVEVQFLNDGWDGGANDRNLFIKSISLGGKTYDIDDVYKNTAAAGQEWWDPKAAVMASGGSVFYDLVA